MARIGLISFSDGRDFVARDVDSHVRQAEHRLADLLRAGGHEVVTAREPITSSALATGEARRLAAQRPDATIFVYSVWAFPHFSLLAARELDAPLLLLGNLDPQYPGMVGMLAAGGALDQLARTHERAWGDPADPAVAAKIATFARAAGAVGALRGSTFGRIGGRSMGMNTAVAGTDRWIRQFGVDVEEIDQWEIVRRAALVDADRVRAGRDWLERHAAGVHYDGRQLTPESLERQIRSYHAMRELIDEWGLDFSGIKAQPELTTHFATMDVTEAFLNDPYDWEGPKDVHVCATEADMDGALTMQLLTKLTGTPVLFADVRHYDAEHDVWDLCNSGQHATWYAARSDDPAENLRRVNLFPEDFYFPAGGASVHHVAAPGACTFARLTRLGDRYRMQVMRGELVALEADLTERLMRASTYHWPHAFARLDAGVAEVLGRFGANHVHAVPGDVEDELRAVCRLLDVDFDRLGSPEAGDGDETAAVSGSALA
jgi:L-fucose isomerase